MKYSKILLIVMCFFQFSCGNNILAEFAKTDTDEAKLKAAQMLMNKGEWDEAVDLFDEMSDGFLEKRDVIILHASAYAGRCGYRYFDMVDILTGTMTYKLLKMLMRGFTGATLAQVNDCIQAETLMNQITTSAASRTEGENVFMGFIELAKAGVILAHFADLDDDGDASDDLTNDETCTDTNSASDPIPDLYAAHVGVAVAVAMQSFAEVSTGIGSTEIANFSSSCTTLAAYNFCTATETSDITTDANKMKGVRSIIQDNEFIGLETCTDADLSQCLCP